MLKILLGTILLLLAVILGVLVLTKEQNELVVFCISEGGKVIVEGASAGVDLTNMRLYASAGSVQCYLPEIDKGGDTGDINNPQNHLF